MTAVHLYMIPGTLTRVPDGWCPDCQTSALWEGPIWTLDPTGVERWGWITGCGDCDWWRRVKRAKQP